MDSAYRRQNDPRVDTQCTNAPYLRIWQLSFSPGQLLYSLQHGGWLATSKRYSRWYTFDPTQSDLAGGRVAIAYGRDAADVAVYTQFGTPVELLRMSVTVIRHPEAPS